MEKPELKVVYRHPEIRVYRIEGPAYRALAEFKDWLIQQGLNPNTNTSDAERLLTPGFSLLATELGGPEPLYCVWPPHERWPHICRSEEFEARYQIIEENENG